MPAPASLVMEESRLRMQKSRTFPGKWGLFQFDLLERMRIFWRPITNTLLDEAANLDLLIWITSTETQSNPSLHQAEVS